MWSTVKKAINDNLSEPLNKLIVRLNSALSTQIANIGTQVNSRAAQSTSDSIWSRVNGWLDTSVSSRATQSTADSILAHTSAVLSEQRAGAPAVKSVQRGYIASVNWETLFINISTVNPAKCSFSFTHTKHPPGGSSGVQMNLSISTITSNRITMVGDGNGHSVSWQLVEFY